MRLSEEALDYILSFVSGFQPEDTGKTGFRVGYTARREDFGNYDLVIVPSGFFESEHYGEKASVPVSLLPRIGDLPFLYGSSRVERVGETLVLHADFVASAFFWISRYEELCQTALRDSHGRFLARWSVLQANGLLERPVVDEYGKFIRACLRETGRKVAEPEARIRKLWLTHDVDAPFYCQSLRSLARESLKGGGPVRAWSLYRRKPVSDPYYTFDYFFEQDAAARKGCKFPVEVLYFFKAGGHSRFDNPVYNLNDKKIRDLMEAVGKEARIGLHGSYSSGRTGDAGKEKRRLEKAAGRFLSGKPVSLFRQHFLRSCEPESFRPLPEAGITDDFTMGYADRAGFRLGTCRPVRWIDPATGKLSGLTLHPLTVMDNTLFQPTYMGLDFEQAKACCVRLFREICRHGGEACLLWHNTNVTTGPYPRPEHPWVRDLYTALLAYLMEGQEDREPGNEV